LQHNKPSSKAKSNFCETIPQHFVQRLAAEGTTTRNAHQDGNEVTSPAFGGLEALLTFDRAAEALTAKAYTDVPALGLNVEVAKVPWISAPGAAPGESAQRSAQESEIPGHCLTLGGILAQLIPFMEKASGEELSHTLAFPDAPWRFLKLGAGAGFEPATFRL
jgi:hypothetical protein